MAIRSPDSTTAGCILRTSCVRTRATNESVRYAIVLPENGEKFKVYLQKFVKKSFPYKRVILEGAVLLLLWLFVKLRK